jgi:RsiW-degrading membrane proteinase PrsW (M82 family)
MNLFLLALAPGVAIMVYIYLKDKHEREPLSLLLISFLYGLASTIVTLILSIPVDAWIITDEFHLYDQFINAFLKVAFIEEFCKFIFVRYILFHNKHFNEPFDGIVYAIMVSMGFATFENVLYVMDGGYATGFLRMFTAVPAHATFGILMGYYLGRAKFSQRHSTVLTCMGLCTAILFHGLYDYFLFISFVPGIWLGAIASLLVAVALSRRAIKIHQHASPFKNTKPPIGGDSGIV